jgi:hypothetical protein
MRVAANPKRLPFSLHHAQDRAMVQLLSKTVVDRETEERTVPAVNGPAFSEAPVCCGE